MAELPLPLRPREKQHCLPRYRELVLLWALLVANFVALWAIVSTVQRSGSQAWPWVSAYLLFWGVIAGRFFVRVRRFMRARRKASDLLNAGMLRGAQDRLERLLTKTRLGNLRSGALFDLAYTSLLLGEHEKALALFGELERFIKERRYGVQPELPAYLALSYALAGDIPSAQAWVKEARRRAEKFRDLNKLPVIADAVIHCRQGKFVETETLLSMQWTDLERTMTSDFVRAARLVCAYALEHRIPPDGAAAEKLVAGARESRPGEFEFLGTRWPEMEHFLTAHGFAKAG